MQIIFRWSIKLVSVVGGWLLVGISEFVEYLLSVVGGVLVERRKLELVSVNGGSDSNRTRHSISLSQNYEARYGNCDMFCVYILFGSMGARIATTPCEQCNNVMIK